MRWIGSANAETTTHALTALKALTRTGEAISQTTIREFVHGLDVSDSVKQELRAIMPQNYAGM